MKMLDLTYLYHRVPEYMEGDILYPLNELREKYPEIYEREVAKYKGREFIKEQKVPGLNCLWNDVLHFSPVHPQKVLDELREFGQELSVKKFFKIDPYILEPENTIIYLFQQKRREDKFLPENWAGYDPDNLEQYSDFPERTRLFYKERLNKGMKMLPWVGIPHVMYKGSLDVRGCEIVEVE